jgi:DNA mismatch repair protein MLH1
VRTDTNLRKITSMLAPATATTNTNTTNTNTTNTSTSAASAIGPSSDAPTAAAAAADLAPVDTIEYETVDREATACRLISIRELRAAVREDMHHELTEVFANHSFVGVVDERRRLAAIQGGVKLFLVDYGRVCYEYFYQLGLTDFGNFGVIRFSPPLDLKELLTLAAQQEKNAAAPTEDGGGDDEEFDVAEIVELVGEQLIERREMLLEYFSLEISPTGELLSIPLLVKGYNPAIVKLPRFLLRLGPHVNWGEEKSCFEDFLKELASFYVPEQLPATPGNNEEGTAAAAAAAEEAEIDEEIKARRSHVRRALEHVLFPAFKSRLVATKSLMQGGILEVANLKGLYRVFERC